MGERTEVFFNNQNKTKCTYGVMKQSYLSGEPSKSEIIFKGSSSFILINVSWKVSRKKKTKKIKNMYRAYWIIKCFLSVYVLVHLFHYMKTDDYALEIKFC